MFYGSFFDLCSLFLTTSHFAAPMFPGIREDLSTRETGSASSQNASTSGIAQGSEGVGDVLPDAATHLPSPVQLTQIRTCLSGPLFVILSSSNFRDIRDALF
jgi:hypothetical protein